MDGWIGFLVAAMAGLGIGGGGLLVIYLSFYKDMPQLQAQGFNLLFFLCASGASLLFHCKKRTFHWKIVATLALCGCVGAIFGSLTAAVLNPSLLKKGFGALLILSGLIELFRRKK